MGTLQIRFPNPGRPKVRVDAKKVIELRVKGLSWRRIAKKLGVGLGTVHRAAAAFQKRSNEPVEHTHDGAGRPIQGGPVTTAQACERGIALYEDIPCFDFDDF